MFKAKECEKAVGCQLQQFTNGTFCWTFTCAFRSCIVTYQQSKAYQCCHRTMHALLLQILIWSENLPY